MNLSNVSNKRWQIVNRNTGRVRTSKATRDQARYAKRSFERIYDSRNAVYVR